LEEKFKIEAKATEPIIQAALAKTDVKVLDNYFALNTEYKTTVDDTEFTITKNQKDNKFDISIK